MRQSTTSSARMKYNNVPIKEIIVGLIQPECGGEDAPTLSQVSPGWDSRVPPRYGPVVLDKRKKDVGNQIAYMINHVGVRKICIGKQVQLKIEHLEKSF